jgi:hypothetical protein
VLSIGYFWVLAPYYHLAKFRLEIFFRTPTGTPEAEFYLWMDFNFFAKSSKTRGIAILIFYFNQIGPKKKLEPYDF